ncbi:hypothetical protein EN852_008450 [Mesorhizobium sp. M2E.F.Ca.ET.209.01.1.1]|uniref:hypothetical protein n=1 Tax=Mesorhizobium sp. M2E.F.Ca.ET.209.01.1.1 TaxID=2500526 RepID=UPI000FDAC717|nr:hypothetical protein [Mesorhizobium sp. M2E.F.Ca.ET.209.01.1.1]TGS17207.1 hypothetical protein EN852_008450 [Mesorhizobium sp. M2E.F.Ca.ET.209.01.1.1]
MDLRGVKNWKLKLRYGRAKTEFRHFTILAHGEVTALNPDFKIQPGPAFFGMSVWASDSDQAIDMTRAIGEHLGFACTGDVYVYDTEPTEPPGDKPRGYNLKFTPYERE